MHTCYLFLNFKRSYVQAYEVFDTGNELYYNSSSFIQQYHLVGITTRNFTHICIIRRLNPHSYSESYSYCFNELVWESIRICMHGTQNLSCTMRSCIFTHVRSIRSAVYLSWDLSIDRSVYQLNILRSIYLLLNASVWLRRSTSIFHLRSPPAGSNMRR